MENNVELNEQEQEQEQEQEKVEIQEQEEKPEIDTVAILQEQLKDKESPVYKAFTEAVKAEVEKRLAGRTPKANTTDRGKAELDRFCAMSYKERAELAKADPDTYKKLVQLERGK